MRTGRLSAATVSVFILACCCENVKNLLGYANIEFTIEFIRLCKYKGHIEMIKIDEMGLKLCRMQAKVFEISLSKEECSLFSTYVENTANPLAAEILRTICISRGGFAKKERYLSE